MGVGRALLVNNLVLDEKIVLIQNLDERNFSKVFYFIY